MTNELDEFLSTFKFKIGKESFDKVSKVLRGNDFTSHLSLKVMSSGAGLLFRGQTPVAHQTVAYGRRLGRGAFSPGKFLKLKVWKRHFMATKGRK